MSAAMFLSTLLMLGVLGGAALSDLKVYGKSIHSDKTLQSSDDGRHSVKKQPHQQWLCHPFWEPLCEGKVHEYIDQSYDAESEMRRSLDLESFSVHVTPSTSRLSLPTIIKLYPPTAKPLHLLANMPMRFGRDSSAGDDTASTPNMPQRFGRSWELFRMCAECHGAREAARPPQRVGRTSLYWRLLRTLANARLLNTSLHWAEDLNFTSSSEAVEMQETSFEL